MYKCNDGDEDEDDVATTVILIIIIIIMARDYREDMLTLDLKR